MTQPDIPGLVKRLRKRIETSRGVLESGEGVTRSALVDPMLRELGWDTSDPTMVWPEYPLDGGQVDYALLRDGEPFIFLEVKKLGEGLAGASDQVVEYCLKASVRFLAVTNGNVWFLYKSPKTLAKSPSLLRTFSVHSTPPEELSEQASLLLRSEAERLRRAQRRPETKSGWRTLENWSKAKGPRRPSVMKFPDGCLWSVPHREYIVLNTVKWLEEKGLLSKVRLPVLARGSARKGTRRFLVADQPVHESGEVMARHERVGKYYVDVDESRREPVKHARGLLTLAGEDPFDVRIKYA